MALKCCCMSMSHAETAMQAVSSLAADNFTANLLEKIACRNPKESHARTPERMHAHGCTHALEQPNLKWENRIIAANDDSQSGQFTSMAEDKISSLTRRSANFVACCDSILLCHRVQFCTRQTSFMCMLLQSLQLTPAAQGQRRCG